MWASLGHMTISLNTIIKKKKFTKIYVEIIFTGFFMASKAELGI